MIDWTPLANAAVMTAAGIVAASAPILVALVNKRLTNKAEADAVDRAIQTGAGIAYDSLTAAGAKGGVDFAAAKATAITEGMAAAQTLVKSIPSEVAAISVTGALGKLLASDPTVNVSGGSTATASAPAGQAAEAKAGAMEAAK